MIVKTEYDDGTRTIILERGDRVRLTGWTDDWIAKNGELGTVIRCRDKKQTSISHLEIQTDAMRDGGWGVITVAPWHVEYIPDNDQADS